MGSDGTLFQGGFTIRIQENYTSMFRAADQFNGGIGGVFPQSGASSVQLNILFNNIPQGFDISGCDVVETYSNGTASTGLAFMNFSSVSAFLPVLTVVLASPGSGKYRSHHFDLHKCKQGIGDSSLKWTRHHCPSEPCARGGSIEQQRWRTNKPYDWVDPAVPASIAAGDTADGCFFLTPRITSISPSSGKPSEVFYGFIAGTRLTGAFSVTFSGTGVSGFVLDNSDDSTTPIEIDISPSATSGIHTVTVTTLQGTSAPFLGFTVIGPKKKSGQITSQ
jgi:hypothetical protein